MARMIPPYIKENVASNAERKIFNLLEKIEGLGIVILDGSVPDNEGDDKTISTVKLAQQIKQSFGEKITLFAASASDESNRMLVSCGAMPTDKISVYPAVRKRLLVCACF